MSRRDPPPIVYSDKEVLEMISGLAAEEGVLKKDIAARLGVSKQSLCDIEAGRQGIPPHVLEKLGLKRVVMYVELKPKKGRK